MIKIDTEDLNILSEEKETANLLHRWNQINGFQSRDGLPSFIDVFHNCKEKTFSSILTTSFEQYHVQ